MKNTKFKKGFTLLELLIVIGIIAILSVILVIVLNPAETLRKARDSQRMSDLNALKTALGIYITSTSTPYLTGTDNIGCKTGSGGGSYSSGDKIYYSLANTSAITDMSIDGGAGGVPLATQAGSTNLTLTDGTGWLPVNFDSLTSGSPISNLPLDPINTIADLNAVVSTDLIYRYACNATSLTFEINAQLESDAYTITDDRRKKDGGNNPNYYEAGTNLKILGTGTDF